MTINVAIFGGGVAGLSVAHELLQTNGDFKITVYEERADVGGKADSQSEHIVSTIGARGDLLGEHGFRFYPGFYRYVTGVMREIKSPPSSDKTVFDHLAVSEETGIAYPGSFIKLLRRPRPDAGLHVFEMLLTVLRTSELMNAHAEDVARAALARLKFASSCDARRATWEDTRWLDFLGGDKLSPQYLAFERALNRTLSAMGPDDTNARDVGEIGLQFLLGGVRPSERTDALLGGPTRDVWLAPWRTQLEGRGVVFTTGARLTALTRNPTSGTITSASVQHADGTTELIGNADFYVCALPLNEAYGLLKGDVADAFPIPVFQNANAALYSRMTQWMVGAQFYLSEDLPLVNGHFFIPDSPWALSGISQAQFWVRDHKPFEALYGDGTVKGVLSVAISDWDTAASGFKAAKDCASVDEVLELTLQQLKVLPGFDLSKVIGRRLDSNVALAGSVDATTPGFATRTEPAYRKGNFVNRSPLLVHPPGSRAVRPKAWSASVPNLLLAADWVSTYTSLATMEGANEAARAAVKALCDARGVVYPQARVPTPMPEDGYFDAAKTLDAQRLAEGRAHLLDGWPFDQLAQGALGFKLLDAVLRAFNFIATPTPAATTGAVVLP